MINKDALVSSLLSGQICQAGEIRGASWDEVAALEEAVGRQLPGQYREFLLAIGHGAGDFLRGTDLFLSALEGLQAEAIQLLKENNEGVELEADAFVFSMHQGYSFTYFNMSDGDNPRVFQYVEGQGEPVLTWNSLSDFLHDAIGQHMQRKNLCEGRVDQ